MLCMGFPWPSAYFQFFDAKESGNAGDPGGQGDGTGGITRGMIMQSADQVVERSNWFC